MESLLSIAGSIASVFGAWWALKEARKSERFAAQAARIRNELIQRHRIAEVAQVLSETKRVLNVIARIGPSSSQQLIRGVNCVDIAQEVESYVRLILELRSHFSDSFKNQVNSLCGDLKADIEGLAEARTFETKKGFGKNMYYKIQNFMPVVKQLADEKQERLN